MREVCDEWHAGVPKFFRWLTERYPLTQERLSDTSSVKIDNLYLDMNGIIHNCTHANEARVTASEEEMIRKCFLYIERLVRLANPEKVLFMAIDGATAPFKINPSNLHENSEYVRSGEPMSLI
jgi:5'-3' exoribonuclease 1